LFEIATGWSDISCCCLWLRLGRVDGSCGSDGKKDEKEYSGVEEYEEEEETTVGRCLPHVGSHAGFFVAAAPVSGAGQGGKREVSSLIGYVRIAT
jgi:hypothetical protein